jgi:hypothetical protein
MSAYRYVLGQVDHLIAERGRAVHIEEAFLSTTAQRSYTFKAFKMIVKKYENEFRYSYSEPYLSHNDVLFC